MCFCPPPWPVPEYRYEPLRALPSLNYRPLRYVSSDRGPYDKVLGKSVTTQAGFDGGKYYPSDSDLTAGKLVDEVHGARTVEQGKIYDIQGEVVGYLRFRQKAEEELAALQELARLDELARSRELVRLRNRL